MPQLVFLILRSGKAKYLFRYLNGEVRIVYDLAIQRIGKALLRLYPYLSGLAVYHDILKEFSIQLNNEGERTWTVRCWIGRT